METKNVGRSDSLRRNLHVRPLADFHRLRTRRRWLLSAAFVVGLVGALSVEPGEAKAELWPGQTPAQAWVQFANGAWGAVTSVSSAGLHVEYWNGTSATSSTYTPDQLNPSGSSSDLFNAAKWAKWAAAAKAGNGITLALAIALDPTDAGTGSTLSERCGNDQICLQTGLTQCAAITSGSYKWIDPPCQVFYPGASTKPEFWYLGDLTGSLPAGATGYSVYKSTYPKSLYPDSPYDQKRPSTLVLFADESSWPSVADMVDPPETLTPELADKLVAAGATPADLPEDPTAQPYPLYTPDGDLVAPDLWGTLPMPQDLPDLPAEIMNPSGYPANGVGVIDNPVAVPDATPWPSSDAWPADHAAPIPGVTPGSLSGAGTGTGTGTGEGTATGSQNITVDFPDKMDVTVINTEFAVETDSGDELDTKNVDFGNFSTGVRWLPNQCPAPEQVDFYGQNIEISYGFACDAASIIGPLMVVICALVGIRIAWGAIQ